MEERRRKGGGGGGVNLEGPSDLTRQVERLTRDLNRRERELDEERRETERAVDRMRVLEKDKVELKRELDEMRGELSEYQRVVEELEQNVERNKSQQRRGDDETKIGVLRATLQERNRENAALIEDIERLEVEKDNLRDKVFELSQSLQEATVQVEDMARHRLSYKSDLSKAEDKIRALEEEKTVLEIREKELFSFKERHDQYLENLCKAVDIRVDVWKKMMFQKDEEIERLNAKISSLLSQIPHSSLDSENNKIQEIKNKLKKREEQINILSEKLLEATEEINSNAKLIKSLQSDGHHGHHEGDMSSREYEKKIRKLETKLEKKTQGLIACEKEAEERSRELVALSTRLRSYEAGHYGLSEAVAEINEIKTQLRIRDRNLEVSTQEINQLQLELSEMSEENGMLRQKLGISRNENLSKEARSFGRKQKNELESLRTTVDMLENEVASLKAKNYELKKLTNRDKEFYEAPPKGIEVREHRKNNLENQTDAQKNRDKHSYYEDWREKYDIILHENTELRKGFQEILESIQRISEDGASDVRLESPVLENLLREMSARGLINYPYAISSFHLKVCNLEGKNSQLREELHRVRHEEKLLRAEIIDAKAQIQILEERLRGMSIKQISKNVSRSPSPKIIVSEEIKKLGENKKEEVIETEKYEPMKDTIEKHSTLVIESLQNEINALREEHNNFVISSNGERAKLEERLRVLVEKGNQIFSSEAQGSELIKRKFNYLNMLRDIQNDEINSLRMRLTVEENSSFEKVIQLEKFRVRALQQITSYHRLLEASVPISLLSSTKKQLLDLSTSYQDLQLKLELNSKELCKKEEECLKLRAKTESLTQELEEILKKPEREINPELNVEEKEEFQRLLNKTSASLESEINEHNKLKSHSKVLEGRVEELLARLIKIQSEQQGLEIKISESVSRQDYDSLTEHLLTVEENSIRLREEVLKWKEMADLAQNQVRALENLKYFDRQEVESLRSQVCDLQAVSIEKSELARVKEELVSAEKEKFLALQQVQKLLTKLGKLEGSQLQQDRLHTDRELNLIASNGQILSKYRDLFSAFHELSLSGLNLVFNCSSEGDISAAWEVVSICKGKITELEEELEKEKISSDKWRQKVETLEEILRSLEEGKTEQINFIYVEKYQESQLETSRWRRKCEQCERMITMLNENLEKAEKNASSLDAEKLKLLHSLQTKESLERSLPEIFTIQPLHSTKSLTQLSLNPSKNSKNTADKSTQVSQEDSVSSLDSSSLTAFQNSSNNLPPTCISDSKIKFLEEECSRYKSRVQELENLIIAKDSVLENLKSFNSSSYERRSAPKENFELYDSLQLSKETISSLNARLRTKEENLSEYKKLLAEVRSEMSSATDRHVQEMRALQMTIIQQQQAFTKMKSTLSHPVRDTSDINGTIKDQLTRINELEDEVSELQHTLGNVAGQLSSARSDAHRWRGTADSRLKEIDILREQIETRAYDEIGTLQLRIESQENTIEELKKEKVELMRNCADETTVNLLKQLLEEKELEIQRLKNSKQSRSAVINKGGAKKVSESRALNNEILDSREKEIEELKKTNKELQQKISKLVVKVSRMTSSNQASGISAEMEQLRTQYISASEERDLLKGKLLEIEKNAEIEAEKKRKTIEGFARWEESKKWKSTVERLESRHKELEEELSKVNKKSESLRTIILRLEKEKSLLESRVKSSVSKRALASTSEPTLTDELLTVEKLKAELSEGKEIENIAKREAEMLRIEVKILKERIHSQEKQLTNYEVMSKGDTRVMTELERRNANEERLQREVIGLEEENFDLKLQLEQLKLDTPRLRDRVQHLQKLIDILKSDKSTKIESVPKSSSHKSLSELEQTISALKSVIEKLQNENKKRRPTRGSSHQNLKTSLESLLSEKRGFLDQVAHLEEEKNKFQKMSVDLEQRLSEMREQRDDAESKAHSAESKLKAFLEEEEGVSSQIKQLKEEIERKDVLLANAKAALEEVAQSTSNKRSQKSKSVHKRN